MQLAQGSHTSSTVSDFSCNVSLWLQLQLVWPLSTLMDAPSSVCPPEESLGIWRERDSPNSRSLSHKSSIDEMSMVGRKTFGQMDQGLHQAFPHHSQEVFGGCSCLLFGYFGQLPPVMDLLSLYTTLYTTDSRTELFD